MNKDQEKREKGEYSSAAVAAPFSPPANTSAVSSGKVKRSFTGPKAPIVINEPIVKRSRTDSGSETSPERKKMKADKEEDEKTGDADEGGSGGLMEDEVMSQSAAEALSKENMKELKKSDSGKYPCSICSHEFTRQESLFQHMGLHDDSLAIKCDLCDMKFAWKSTLRKHKMTVHEGKIMNIPCTVDGCPRTFKSFGHRKVY